MSTTVDYKIPDNRLYTFNNICEQIANERSYLNKAKILSNFFSKGTQSNEFHGDLVLWIKMLIPSDSQRVYNLQNKQLLKLFSRIFRCDLQQMHQNLEQDGDVSNTLSKFFEMSSSEIKPQKESVLYLQDVEKFLIDLTLYTKEDEQMNLLKQLCKQTTSNDLKTIIRIIKQDLRMNAKASHILAAFGPMAYAAYQSTRDLEMVLQQYASNINHTNSKRIKKPSPNGKQNQLIEIHAMTPVSPMLANACNSVEEAFKKSPKGLFSEIKYDGERVQIHKNGNEFKFFSRNLKPVMNYKVKRFKEIIPKVFPDSGEMILDSEIILLDTITGELLPFGSLGSHKKNDYENAAICLFVFDCLLYKGNNLTSLPFSKRRKILEDNIKPLKSYIQLSESYFLKNSVELSHMVAKVLKAHLEGVVLKDPQSTYQPGKRGWIKIKKDYLFGGKMADNADLIVLGASYGSGKKGGILSVFLMGCYDKRDHLWKTVTKVHTGLDDNTRLEQHDHLMNLMIRSNPNKLPSWLMCTKPLAPDFIAKDPFKMPVWEVTGAEFTKSNEHTANGISIRFPRITRLRVDKNAEQSTNLEHLERMYETSKSNINVDLLLKECNQQDLEATNIEINSKLNLTESKISHNEKSRSIITKRKSETLYSEEEKSTKIMKIERNTSKKQEETYVQKRLFQNIMAYFPENLNLPSNILADFKCNGGSIATNTKFANIVFYKNENARISLKESRFNYNSQCRHLHIKWLNDSLASHKLMEYPLYAIILK